MIRLLNKADCSGCGACRDACLAKAVCMEEDEEGFLYPKIDQEKCVHCGRCDAVCPILNVDQIAFSGIAPIAYAVRNKNENTRKKSSSGGVFSEIASFIISVGGVVFGAAMDDECQVLHIAIDKIEDIEKLQGSKYVQSNLGDAYMQAKKYLDEGRVVLFTGTPCQIGGLHNFLKREYEHLYTQDIICHGVPSPMVLKKYVKYQEKKHGANLQKMLFRHKAYGWKKSSVCLEFDNNTKWVKAANDDLYMRAFLWNLSLRPSCYSCAFKTKYRNSDFTLADFWGVDNICPNFDDGWGTSLVITHSNKANKLLKKMLPCFIYERVNFEESIKYNSSMTKSVSLPKERMPFFVSIRKKGFEGVRKYVRTPISQKLKRIIKRVLKI